MGRLILLFTYWLIILCMLFANSIISGAYYYEKIAFRAAWVSVSQVPLVVLLTSKNSIVGWLVNSSHERLNWLHRWVARTLLLTVTVHFAFFFREWTLANFVSTEIQMMPMVKYGLISYGVLFWIVLSSFLPIRAACYELFVVQHAVSGAVFLWAVHSHVPAYARYNLWMAVGFWVFDRAVRSARVAYNNLSIFHLRRRSKGATGGILACNASLEVLSGVTRITIARPPFSWKPGQHVFVQLPTIAPFSAHPFTLVSLPSDGAATFVVRAHTGFTCRLHAHASTESRRSADAIVPAILDGPYGAPPTWSAFETLVLIAGATGASFTIPILRSVLAAPGAVRRIVFCWVVKRPQNMEWYERDLQAAIQAAAATRSATGAGDVEKAVGTTTTTITSPSKSQSQTGVDLSVRIYVSCGVDAACIDSPLLPRSSKPAPTTDCCCAAEKTPTSTSTTAGIEIRPASSSSSESERACCCCAAPSGDEDEDKDEVERVCIASGRPPLYELIDEALCAARGETGVAVCGPPLMNAQVRNAVAALSDDRAVHKGSGAQGVFLYSEGFAW